MDATPGLLVHYSDENPPEGSDANAGDASVLRPLRERPLSRELSVRDAGFSQAELAWEVAHLPDMPPGTMRTLETNSVLLLTRRGAEGVRAVSTVFSAGDGTRVPFARRVLEHVADRACFTRHDRAVRLLVWLEQGQYPARPPAETGVAQWLRAATQPWPVAALRRLDVWTSRGLFCAVPQDLLDADAGGPDPDLAQAPMDAGLDARREAGR